MAKPPQEAWESTINELKGSLEEEIFDLWVKPTKYVSFEGGVLNLEVPNKFFKGWLTDRYMNLLNSAVQKASGKDLKIEFVSKESESGEVTQTTALKEGTKKDRLFGIFPRPAQDSQEKDIVKLMKDIANEKYLLRHDDKLLARKYFMKDKKLIRIFIL